MEPQPPPAAEVAQEAAAPVETPPPVVPVAQPPDAPSAQAAAPLPGPAVAAPGILPVNLAAQPPPEPVAAIAQPPSLPTAPPMAPVMTQPARLAPAAPSPAGNAYAGMMAVSGLSGCAPGMMASEQPLMAPQQGPLPGGLPMGAGGAPPSNPGPAPYRQLKVEDALAYLDQVKMKFEKQPHIYNQVRARSPHRAHTHVCARPRPRRTASGGFPLVSDALRPCAGNHHACRPR